MCIMKMPKVPKIPERQAPRPPNQSDVVSRQEGRQRRRMGYLAAIKTGPRGTLGAPNVTGIVG